MSIRNILRTFRHLNVHNLTSLKNFREILSLSHDDSLQCKRIIRMLKRKVGSLIKLVHMRTKDTRKDLIGNVPAKGTGEYFGIFPIEWERLVSIAKNFHFHVSDTTEYVDEEYNFSRLNIGKDHPGREEHGYFDINNNQFLLRSHSTANHFTNDGYGVPSTRLLSLGRVYRNDRDKTHLNAFHQVEVLIKEPMSLQGFIILVRDFLSTFLGRRIDIKVRPSYFPFTYLSFEIDLLLDSKIYEVAGAGIMMPNIIGGDHQGPALAFGFERLIMIKYGFEDIKRCYSVFRLEDVS